MKKALILFITLLFSNIGFSQEVSLVFSRVYGAIEGINMPTYSIDSLWQLGIPDKQEFQSPYGNDMPYVLCTDTLNYVSDTGKWEMYFGVNRDTLDFLNNCIYFSSIYAAYTKFGGVPDSTGILLEVSPDNERWFNILSENAEEEYIQFSGFNSEFRFGDLDSISFINSTPVWTPKSSWQNARGYSVWHNWSYEDAGSVHEMHMKISYVSNTFTPHLGVAFSGLGIDFAVWCEGIGIGDMEGTFEPNLYPNPVTSSSILEIPQDIELPLNLMISDPTGRVIYNEKLISRKFQLKKAQLGQGVYMYFLKGEQGNHAKGKFIVKT
jgi:hypothetical protein